MRIRRKTADAHRIALFSQFGNLIHINAIVQETVQILYVCIYIYICILHFTFLFSLFVFVSAAGHYFRIWTGSIWTGQVPALLF